MESSMGIDLGVRVVGVGRQKMLALERASTSD